MRGSIVYQVQQVFAEVNSIGESKHEAKEYAVENGANTKHEIAKQMGIHSYSTADAYRDIWKDALNFAKENFSVKDIEKLNGEHIKAYLEQKIQNNVAHSTFMQYASALEKLEVALNRYAENHNTGKEYEFANSISEVRELAHQELERFDNSRAYENPQELIKSIQNENYNLAATIQYEAGLRLSELGTIKNLNTENKSFEVQGKGGKIRVCEVSEKTFGRLENYLKNNDFRWDKSTKDEYRETLKEASLKTGQEYNGSHGLRWNYAQERFAELQENGKSYNESLIQVSSELGHERADITEHYLK